MIGILDVPRTELAARTYCHITLADLGRWGILPVRQIFHLLALLYKNLVYHC